jgi:hypothetical protein
MIAYRGSSSGTSSGATSVSVTLPTEAVDGDLLLIAILVAGGTGVTITAPTGVDLVLSTTDTTTGRQSVYEVVKTDALSDPLTFTLSTSAAHVWGCLAYGGVDLVTPVDVSAGQANASSTNCTTTGATTTKTNAHLLHVGGSEASARTFTPPSGFTERIDTAGSSFSLGISDARQATIAASGSKTSTLSGASANIAQLVALAPSALNTPAAVQNEGNWRYETWAPRFTTNTLLLAFLEEKVQAANADLRQRIGASFYAENALFDPWLTRLTQAEMDLTQALILEVAAQLAEAADEQNPVPFLGSAESLRRAASRRRGAAQEVITLTRSSSVPGPKGPYFQTAVGASSLRPRFDREEGLPEDE